MQSKREFGMSNRPRAFGSMCVGQALELRVENERLRKIARSLLLENMEAQRVLDRARGEPLSRNRAGQTITGMGALLRGE